LYARKAEAEGELMDLSAAVADFGNAPAIDSSSDLVFLHRGIAQFHLGQFRAAPGDLKKSMQLNPYSANAWRYAGYCDEGRSSILKIRPAPVQIISYRLNMAAGRTPK
jgi:tetratricopeptide (TPR) repeat protein